MHFTSKFISIIKKEHMVGFLLRKYISIRCPYNVKKRAFMFTERFIKTRSVIGTSVSLETLVLTFRNLASYI